MVGRWSRLAGLAAAFIVLVVPAANAGDPREALSASSSLQRTLLQQVNALRARHGLPRLRPATGLGEAAGAHSTQMARLGYFSHDSANGASFSARIASYYRLRGYHRWAVGENLLWASPDIGASRALKLWLASPPHRANLLSRSWREIGLGAIHASNAPGVYHDAQATIITVDFGARS